METRSETLAQLFASARERQVVAVCPPLPALRRGEVIEIQGPSSSGKTHLLYHIVLAVLAPSQRAQIAAVVYDTDASFDVARLRHLLLSRSSGSAHDPHESVRRSLARLHLFRPTSLPQLAASIAALPAYHAAHMPDQEIALLAVDSVTAFYWPDRYVAEQLPSPVSPLRHVLAAIQSLRSSHAPLVVLTNWALASPSSDPLYRQHLHPPDANANANATADHSSSSPFHLAHHIALSSPPSIPSPPVREACRTSIRDGQLHGFTSSSGARDAVRFVLQITDDDVLVQSSN